MDPAPKRTLMEKWKEHYDTKDEIFKIEPKRANKAGVVFFWFFSLVLTYSAVYIMIPQLNKYEVNKEFWCKLSAWFIFFQLLINWILTARIRPSQVNEKTVPQDDDKLVRSLPEGWKSCPTCQLDAPPRSHHCKICDMCVLKRDHHCFFSGTCVGFFNQRYFVVFSFYAAIGCIYGLYLIFRYLSDPLPLFSRHCVSYLFPVAFGQWLFGYLSTAHFLFIMELYSCLICSFGSIWFLLWELFMIYRGQTSYEAMKGIQRYRLTPAANFQSVFGPFWILNFIIPLPVSQTGNGVDWLIRGKSS